MAKQQLMYMETTCIDASKTAGEVMVELRKAGAKSINQDFGPGGAIVGMKWVQPVMGRDMLFEMPIRVDPVLKRLTIRRGDRQHAERVAWRQLLRWIQAQNAMITCGMAQAHEVFAPYMVVGPGGETLFQMIESGSQLKILASPTNLSCG